MRALILALVLGMLLAPNVGATSTFSVTFQVSDESGNGLPDSTVQFDGRWCPCDTSGRVTIPTTRGDHEWVVNSPGREVRRGTVSVDGDERVDVRLSATDTTIDETDDAPQSGQDVISGYLEDDCCCTVAVLLVILMALAIMRRFGVI
jgi:hypothetical protein